MAFTDVYRGKKVLLTGHTGFKGSWLSEWLLMLGAEVTGFSLPPTELALFEQLGLDKRLNHLTGNVRDHESVCQIVNQVRLTSSFILPLNRLSGFPTPLP